MPYTFTNATLNDLESKDIQVSKNGNLIITATSPAANKVINNGDSVLLIPINGASLSDVYFTTAGGVRYDFSYDSFENRYFFIMTSTSLRYIYYTASKAPPVGEPVYIFNSPNYFESNILINDVIAVNGTKVYSGDVLTYSINSGYELVKLSIISNGVNILTSTPYTFDDSIIDSIEMDVVKSPEDVSFKLYGSNIAEIAPAKVFVNDVEVNEDTFIRVKDVIKITKPDGYEFAMGQYYVDTYLDKINTSTGERWRFELVDDYATYTVSKVVSSRYQPELICKLNQLTPEVTGNNAVYIIDNDILTELNRKRFKIVPVVNPSDSSKIDYGVYMLSLMQIPFKVDPILSIGESDIYLADYNTEVKGDKLAVDKITFDLGEISVEGVNKNVLDYANTVGVIHLPYSPSITIETNYIIDKTISIKYVLDCYTGEFDVLIFSNGMNISQSKVDFSVNIPYASTNSSPDASNVNINLGGDNGIRTAFIEILRNESILPNGMFTIPIIDERKLSGANGFIQVEQIDLISKAVKNEKDELISILNRGVIIK